MANEAFDLSGRVAMVTGGNGGIGLGMAHGLAKAGASIAIAARDQEKMETAQAALEAAGADVMTCAVDVADRVSIDEMVGDVVARFGRLDIMVANAGINIRKPPQDYAPEEWQKIMDVNLNGPFFCAQAVYPLMKKQGGGKIITIGSMASILGLPFASAYASTKGGIVQMTRVLATAWAKDNIQANAILPGWIDTDLTKKARLDVDGLHDRVVERTPAGRWGNPEDFAGIAVFLASSASDFMTGTAIPVDGGYSINGG
ncbi:MAG: SDR family NAD(P)-dependent oxidoreductase [Geminicoccales bacterium]